MKATLEIQNLKCGGCAHTMTSKLNALKGIEAVNIQHEKSMVTFQYENEEVLVNAKKILIQIGYPVVGHQNALASKVKSFISCALGKINR